MYAIEKIKREWKLGGISDSILIRVSSPETVLFTHNHRTDKKSVCWNTYNVNNGFLYDNMEVETYHSGSTLKLKWYMHIFNAFYRETNDYKEAEKIAGAKLYSILEEIMNNVDKFPVELLEISMSLRKSMNEFMALLMLESNLESLESTNVQSGRNP